MTQRLRYTDLAPAGIAAMRALEHYCNTATLLDPVLLELVRLRASHLNGCGYCVGMHSHELEKHNETAHRIAAVADPASTPDAYTHREQAAFTWTEAVTNIQQGHASNEAYDAARAHFSETDLVNLTLAIVSINTWNRMAIAFRAEHTAAPPEGSANVPPEPVPTPTEPDQSAVDDDGGKVTVED